MQRTVGRIFEYNRISQNREIISESKAIKNSSFRGATRFIRKSKQ